MTAAGCPIDGPLTRSRQLIERTADWRSAGVLDGRRKVCTATRHRRSGHRSNLRTIAKRDDVKRNPITNGIYASQVHALYQQIPTALTDNMVDSALLTNCVGVSSGQIQLADIPRTECSFTAVRTVGWARYQRRQKADANPSKWALCATLRSGLSGLLSGVRSTFFACR